MIQNYELYFILDPKLEESAIDQSIAEITEVLEKTLKATDIKVDKEGVKRFAYPIKKSWNGFYVLINYKLSLSTTQEISKLEKKMNLMKTVWRYLNLNQTLTLKLQTKETPREEIEFETPRDYNKGKRKKACYINYLGIKALDYKNADLLSEFTSPYSKIFGKKRTGTASINQRKLKTAIKRARHMALMPFSTKHM
jgi:small subunit ribosomal protein S18